MSRKCLGSVSERCLGKCHLGAVDVKGAHSVARRRRRRRERRGGRREMAEVAVVSEGDSQPAAAVEVRAAAPRVAA